jgi:hypothetical protein
VYSASELRAMVSFSVIFAGQRWRIRVCLVPHFTQNFLGFGPSFCKIELNTIQNFLVKRYPFSILDFGLKRSKKKAKKLSLIP